MLTKVSQTVAILAQAILAQVLLPLVVGCERSVVDSAQIFGPIHLFLPVGPPVNHSSSSLRTVALWTCKHNVFGTKTRASGYRIARLLAKVHSHKFRLATSCLHLWATGRWATVAKMVARSTGAAEARTATNHHQTTSWLHR